MKARLLPVFRTPFCAGDYRGAKNVAPVGNVRFVGVRLDPEGDQATCAAISFTATITAWVSVWCTMWPLPVTR